MTKTYHKPMHTAEHILNQIMLKDYTKARSFTTHIEKKKSKVDYHFDRNLTDDELLDIQNKVNKIIDSSLDVTENFLSYAEAAKDFNLEKLPADAGNKIRIINIGNFDSCPCIGQHVKNTNEIGKFKIISSSFNENVLRLRFKLEHNIEK
ncbi:MAG: hypothetical protein CR986_05245 [Ignavibacteriae bacterium]|nr:MAG: hypothetical protein CR986_05245 [Ignavibacteriota bacterium]